jgi:hypothetical protein
MRANDFPVIYMYSSPGEPNGIMRLAFSNLSSEELGTAEPVTGGLGTGADMTAGVTVAGFACIFWYAASDTAPKAAPPTRRPSFSVI